MRFTCLRCVLVDSNSKQCFALVIEAVRMTGQANSGMLHRFRVEMEIEIVA